MILEYIFLFVFVMVGVAFITLMERKVLGYMQLRIGPNKISILGILQPVADAVKLFMKEKSVCYTSNKVLYSIFPYLSLFLMLMVWSIFLWEAKMPMNMNFMFFYVISGLSVYVILGSGWSSNSKYSLLGAYRGVAQTVSYEVSMAFVLISIMLTLNSFSFKEFKSVNVYGIELFYSYLLVLFFWLIIVVAEVNRAPFDFAEGESELVSGFNVEYGAGNFALLFLAEYGNIYFMSYLTTLIFLNFKFLYVVFFVFFIIWIRGTYPRYRYDNLMKLSWKVVLPFSIYFMFIVYVYMYM